MRCRTLLSLIPLFSTIHTFSLLRESDRRIDTRIKENTEIFVKLNFEKKFGNFLVFYDFTGVSYYLKFKIDRWDYKPEKIAKKLVRGNTYKVKFIYLGTSDLIPEKWLINLPKYLSERRVQRKPLKKYKLRHRKDSFFGKFIKYDYTTLDDLRF